MEITASKEEIQENFDLVLKTVQDTAREQVARLTGQRQYALTEEVNNQTPRMVTGRLSNNMIVHYPGDASLVGKIVEVELTENRGFYFVGRRV